MFHFPRHRISPVFLVLAGVIVPVSAQLPTITEGDRLGYFATYKDRNIEFGIATQSKVRLMPALSDGLSSTFLGGTYTMEIVPQLIATADEGKTTVRRIADNSLTSPDGITDEFEKTTITGEVTGGAKFEYTLRQNRGTLVMGGRFLNPEEIKTPHHFAIAIKVPAQLTSGNLETLYKLIDAPEDDRAARRELRDFHREFRSDRLTVRRIDGSETRYQLAEPVEGGVAAVNGPGIAELELQSGIYEARRLVITAQEGSAITMETTRDNLLQPGFTLTWKADPAKDPEAKACVAITVR
ncbi:MAG TPA: hypothetical protein VLO11_04465 [Luteolibacter sp.]|nr:hypothetical protein [Luteolibacter sp.]